MIQKTVLQTHEWGEPAAVLSLNRLAWTQIKLPYTGNFTKEFEHLSVLRFRKLYEKAISISFL